MSIAAVVFDMDGVLIDSEVIWRRVRAEYAAEIGRHWRQDDQAAMMGCSTAEWSARMHQRLGLTDIAPAQLAAEIIRRVQAAYQHDVPVRPGAAEALAALGRRWPLALATGSPQVLADLAMASTGFGAHFRAIVYGDEVAHGKPNPAIYLLALQRLGVAAAQAVGIEDSAFGLRALRAAGMWAIAAPGPEFPLTADELAQAHTVVADLSTVTADFVDALPAAAARDPRP